MKQNHSGKVSDEELINAFNEVPHIGKLKAKLGLPEVTIWRRLKSLGLKAKNPGGKRIDLQEILDGKHPHYQTFKLRNRLIKEGLKQNKCDCCGISEWNGKEIVCHLDHIDGNNSNHSLENLRILCPNCHSQTDTWCGKNK